MVGASTSNYAGIYSATLNPSSISLSKFYLDANILTIDVFAINNYLFIDKEKYRFSEGINNYAGLDNKKTSDKYDIKDHDVDKQAYAGMKISGISFMLSTEHHSVAFQNSFRTEMSARDIPYHVAKFIYDGTDYSPQQNERYTADEYSIVFAAWQEYGLTYSYGFNSGRNKKFSIGATVKMLSAYGGGYLTNYQSDYMVVNDTLLQVYDFSAEYGYSVPYDYATHELATNEKKIKGRGWGFDIGINYQKQRRANAHNQFKKICEAPYENYHYRIGISILDIGRIKYTEKAEKHEFQNQSANWNGINRFTFDNINQFKCLAHTKY